MSERGMLAELIGEVQYLGGLEEMVADHILASGRVVVLPCQWGTKLYSVFAALHNLLEDDEPPIKEVWLVEDNVCAIVRQFGKTVFLTQEEAEQALKGGVE